MGPLAPLLQLGEATYCKSGNPQVLFAQQLSLPWLMVLSLLRCDGWVESCGNHRSVEMERK